MEKEDKKEDEIIVLCDMVMLSFHMEKKRREK